jgi:hypothetical protein
VAADRRRQAARYRGSPTPCCCQPRQRRSTPTRKKRSRTTLLIRCLYAPPRRFLNRVPKFDSWRGHLRKRGLDGAAAKPPRLQVGIASDADASAQVQFLPGSTYPSRFRRRSVHRLFPCCRPQTRIHQVGLCRACRGALRVDGRHATLAPHCEGGSRGSPRVRVPSLGRHYYRRSDRPRTVGAAHRRRDHAPRSADS